MRREAVEKLQAIETRPPHAEIHDPAAALKKFTRLTPAPRFSAAPQIHLLVRTPEQLEAALTLAPASITLDYLDLYGLRPSIERVKSSGIPARVASPRVLKPGEARILNFLIDLDCPILVRPAGLVHALRERAHAALIGDFSLNVANSIAAELFLDLGVDRLTPTHDLNAAQVAPWPSASARKISKPSPTSTCPSSTPSTASSAASSRQAPATATAAAPAKNTASHSRIPKAAPTPSSPT